METQVIFIYCLADTVAKAFKRLLLEGDVFYFSLYGKVLARKISLFKNASLKLLSSPSSKELVSLFVSKSTSLKNPLLRG